MAYVIGLAIGDGNLSNSNGRAVRLRITCDNKYPEIIGRIKQSIQELLPNNKVSTVFRTKSYCDISCYSNHWENILGWKVGLGSKIRQNVKVPNWIKKNKRYTRACLKGLIETDGSVYSDRKYKMINFVSGGEKLAQDVYAMINSLGFNPKIYKIQNDNARQKYTIRLAKNVEYFIKKLNISKK